MAALYNGQFPELFRLLICGSSGKGKSSLIQQIMLNKHGILNKNFERLIYLRGVETNQEGFFRSLFRNNMITFDDIPEEDELLPLLRNNDKTTLLLLEDLDVKAFNSPLISRIYKMLSHHWNFSVIVTTQNCFVPGKERLTLIRNSTHIIIFANDLDHSIVRNLASRLHPQKPKAFIKLFEYVTSKEPFSYISVWSNCEKELRYRSHITDPIQKVYLL